jgi:hypothetical protein
MTGGSLIDSFIYDVIRNIYSIVRADLFQNTVTVLLSTPEPGRASHHAQTATGFGCGNR